MAARRREFFAKVDTRAKLRLPTLMCQRRQTQRNVVWTSEACRQTKRCCSVLLQRELTAPVMHIAPSVIYCIDKEDLSYSGNDVEMNKNLYTIFLSAEKVVRESLPLPCVRTSTYIRENIFKVFCKKENKQKRLLGYMSGGSKYSFCWGLFVRVIYDALVLRSTAGLTQTGPQWPHWICARVRRSRSASSGVSREDMCTYLLQIRGFVLRSHLYMYKTVRFDKAVEQDSSSDSSSLMACNTNFKCLVLDMNIRS